MDASESNSNYPRLSAIARRIMNYLQVHPNAQDSLEGIVEWWLLEQRIMETALEVSRALQELVEKGLVLEQIRPKNPVYRLNRLPPSES